MLARSASKLRQGSRCTSSPALFSLPNSHATFNSSAIHHEPTVPVISYFKSKRLENELAASKSNGLSGIAGVDAQRIAVPLSSKAYTQLTPTLRKFTLPGKVAVVTG